MREIKFRAWDKKTKEWISTTANGLRLDGAAISISDFHHDPSDIVLMQYTGLKDANGVEIYEGDIVKDWTGTYQIISSNRYPGAFWQKDIRDESPEDHGAGDYRFLLGYASTESLEVIGNTHNNPDLLA